MIGTRPLQMALAQRLISLIDRLMLGVRNNIAYTFMRFSFTIGNSQQHSHSQNCEIS